MKHLVQDAEAPASQREPYYNDLVDGKGQSHINGHISALSWVRDSN